VAYVNGQGMVRVEALLAASRSLVLPTSISRCLRTHPMCIRSRPRVQVGRQSITARAPRYHACLASTPRLLSARFEKHCTDSVCFEMHWAVTAGGQPPSRPRKSWRAVPSALHQSSRSRRQCLNALRVMMRADWARVCRKMATRRGGARPRLAVRVGKCLTPKNGRGPHKIPHPWGW
jgi:hypothetical protein